MFGKRSFRSSSPVGAPASAPALDRAVELLAASRYTIALTGAGVSTPSGIPDFRSERSGMWKHVDPLEVASLWGFHDHPERFYDWFRPLMNKAMRAQPNAAHRALARMEAAGRLMAVITQNIDSLHQQAGSRCVLELHGHTRTATCLSCGGQVDAGPLLRAALSEATPPRCEGCGGLLKPDVILFGEPLPYDTVTRSQAEALRCDVMLVVGTSLEVMPAADLPLLARRRGAKLVLVNLSPTPLDAAMDVVVRLDVEAALGRIAAGLGV
ncbi:MAG: NAD-dependent deacylase [Anaerolineae bacterium]|nr:NAD-dependent deacylase [Anaerolineae bacterium]